MGHRPALRTPCAPHKTAFEGLALVKQWCLQQSIFARWAVHHNITETVALTSTQRGSLPEVAGRHDLLKMK